MVSDRGPMVDVGCVPFPPSFAVIFLKKKKKLKPRNEGKSETLGHCREDDTGNLTSSAH